MLASLVVLVGAGWWFVTKVTDSDRAAADTGSSAAVSSSGAPTSGAVQPKRHSGSRHHAPRTGPRGTGTASRHHWGSSRAQQRAGQHSKRPPTEPQGPCAPSDVGIDVISPDSLAGKPDEIKLRFTSTSAAACTLAITPSEFVLRITSGDDVVWSSDECPNELLAQQLVVRPHPAAVYTFGWNGHRSTLGCTSVGEAAKAGGYWAEAAVIGGDVYRGYFDVR